MVEEESYGGRGELGWKREVVVKKERYGEKGEIWWKREVVVKEGVMVEEGSYSGARIKCWCGEGVGERGGEEKRLESWGGGGGGLG